jgi:hypothetical protein
MDHISEEEKQEQIQKQEITNTKNGAKREKEKDNRKSKEERVKEGVHLLKQLIDAGVRRGGSFEDLKAKVDEWIRDGNAWAGKVRFEEYGRIAEVILPSKSGVVASLIFRVHSA